MKYFVHSFVSPSWSFLTALAFVAFGAAVPHATGGDAPSDGAVPRDSAAVGAATLPHCVERVRLLLLAGRPSQASMLLADELREPADDPRHTSMLAFYLGLAHEASERRETARPFLLRIRELQADCLSGADARFFTIFAGPPTNLKSVLQQWGQFVFPTAVLADDAADSVDLGEVARFVGDARVQFSSEASLESQVRLATWLLLFAELATETPALGLWSVAADAFEEGSELLARIEATIDADPSVEGRLSATPALAMRLDAARVRKASMDARRDVARSEERRRLEQLREIVGAYRDATRELALFNLHALENDEGPAQASTQVALASLAKIVDIVKQRGDAHLFTDEPALEANAAFAPAGAPPEPFAADTVALLKTLQSLVDRDLAAHRQQMPSDGDGPDGPTDTGLLKRAQAWAQSALGDAPAVELPESAAGNDPSSALAHYALGLAQEDLGRLKLTAQPVNVDARREAELDFTEARSHFARAAELLAGAAAGGKPDGGLADRVRTAAERLRDPTTFLAAADRLTAQGRPRAAWELLQGGLERHDAAAIWLARAEHGRRGRVAAASLLAELDSAFRAGLLRENGVRAALARAKIALDEVTNALNAPALAGAEREQLAARIQSEIAALRESREKTRADASAAAEVDAHLALALACSSLLDARLDQSVLTEAYRLARDASAALEAQLAREQDGAKAIQLREALIAGRLAQGHLAVAVLPDYRDEPLLAFSAAFDEAARLPFARSDVKSLGSPLLTALSRRPSEAGNQLAREERGRREMMTRFVEAAFTLEFGEPGAAGNQMARALDAVSTSGGGEDGALTDAPKLLAQADGFDAQVSLRDSLQAFRALAEVAAGRSESALLDLLRSLLPDAPLADVAAIDQLHVSRAVSKVQSPLTGYALALALDARLDVLDLADTRRLKGLSQQALSAQRRTGELLKSLRLTERYPHLVALNRQLGERLEAPEHSLSLAAGLRLRGDIDGAVDELRQGIRRHPESQPLWQAYAETQLDRLKRENRDAGFGELLAELDGAAAVGLLSEYQHQLTRGAVHELRGEHAQALAAFSRALGLATSPEQRVLARAKAAAARARSALAQK